MESLNKRITYLKGLEIITLTDQAKQTGKSPIIMGFATDESSREVFYFARIEPMRRIVLIDGENLVYGIRHMLGSNGDRAPRVAIENFNFRGLLEEVLADNVPSEILWFGAKLMHIGYETRPIYALTKASDITRTITLPLVQKYKT